MTKEELTAAGIILEYESVHGILLIEAGIEWLENNTSVPVDRENLAALPSGAKLFLVQFAEIVGRSDNITSESIDGLSRSFSIDSKDKLIFNLASALLGKYLTGQVKVFPAVRRWT